MNPDELETLYKKLTDLEIELRNSSIAAVEIYEEIVQFSTENNLDPSTSERAAQILSNHIKNASIFKSFKMMEKVRRIKIVPKFLLVRHLTDQFTSAFSIESSLSSSKCDERTEQTNYSGTMKKGRLPYPMAYGINNNGKLGVGSLSKIDSEFQKIELNDPIYRVYIGEEHTIFSMENDEVFGAGKSENFIQTKGNGCLATPVKLDYLRLEFQNNSHIPKLTSTSTTFFNFKPNYKLIVGKDHDESDSNDDCNWKIEEMSSSKPSKVDKEVTIRNSLGVPFTFKLDKKQRFYLPTNEEDDLAIIEYQAVTFFICGNRIKTEKSWTIKYGNDGIVWLCKNGTLFKGTLKLAPKAFHNEQKTETILVAIMEEVNLEYYIQEFDISLDGKSMIVYNTLEASVKKLSCINDAVKNMKNYMEYEYNNFKSFEENYSFFKKYLIEIKTYKMYKYSGLPSIIGGKVLPWIHTIRQFIEVDEPTQLPKILCKCYEEVEYVDDDAQEPLERSVNEILKENRLLNPIVIDAEWDQKEEREKEINRKILEYCTDLLAEIDRVVRILDNLPLIYHQTSIESDFKKILSKLMIFASGAEYKTCDAVLDVIGATQEFKNVEKIIKDRKTQGDIDEMDGRFELIRVEAIAFDSDEDHIPYSIRTTLSHIKIIDKDLPNHIHRGILNLNEYCHTKFNSNMNHKRVDELFRKLLDMFFVTSMETVPDIDFMDNINDLFTPEECYIVETNDGKTSQVPRIIFEIHSSGFDAARRRNAEREGKDPNRFSLDIPEHLIKILVNTLIDVRVIQNESIETMFKILHISQYCLFIDVLPSIFSFIVTKAKNEDFEIIQQLFCTFPLEMMDTVSSFRPGMLIYWKDFPMKGNYLELLEKTALKINDNIRDSQTELSRMNENDEMSIFRESSIRDLPEKKIDEIWLQEHLMDEDQDDDLKIEFKKTVNEWQPIRQAQKPIRKRNHEGCTQS